MSIYNMSKYDRSRARTAPPRPRLVNGRPMPPRGQPPAQPTQTFPAPSFDEFQLLSSEKHGQHHLMDFKTNKKVDFKAFTPPVKLHRKEPDRVPYRQYIQQLQQQNGKTSPAAGGSAEGQPTSHGPKTGADTSLIAPMGGATRNKQMLFKKRTKQIYLAKEDTRELKEQEQRPWILEDIEGQNNFTGTLEGGQRSDYVLFVLAENGFKVVPVDRWYKFQPKRNFKTLSIEEAEEQLKKQQKHESQRWMMLERRHSGSENAVEDSGPRNKFRVVDSGERSGNKFDGEAPKHDSDIDDLDFDDDFQDDEEGAGDHEAEDEDVKDSKERVKKEFKDFKMNGGDDYDLEDLKDEIKLSTEGKQMRKLVRDLEKNQDYDSDDDKDPYASSADEVASDDEVKKSDEESKDKSTPTLPKKKQTSTSKLFMPKKAPSKVKKEGISRSIGRPESPILNKKKESSPGTMSSPLHKPTSPPQNSHRASSPIAVDQNRKRKLEDSLTDSNKQRKTSVTDDDLITEQEVIETLRGRRMTIKEFLMSFRKRIKKNPHNREIVTALLKKVARHSANDDPNTHMIELKPELQKAH